MNKHFGVKIKRPAGVAEDQNLNKISMRKAFNCHYLTLTFSVLNITLHYMQT
jgi:hypothetical protein